jgi:hypothetical protein
LPHVVLYGSPIMREVFQKLVPTMVREEKMVLKTMEAYINNDEKSILVEALAIEDDQKSSFLVLLAKREDGLVIRIYPNSIVEKTNGVKMILAKIAKMLIEEFPGLKLGKTNLQDFL